MVLLTSSTVSAIISVGVICTFTFLLFLSGYVLQQQTVKSLQEALRQPPVPRAKPTLPSAFQNLQDVANLSLPGGEEQTQQIFAPEGAVTGDSTEPVRSNRPVVGDETGQENSWPEESPVALIATDSDLSRDQVPESLAYILTLPNPADVCSAILFARQQRQHSSLQTSPKMMILYPATWETSQSPVHLAALTLMRDVQDEYSLTYHPVHISTVWSGVGYNAHLLGELQRLRWDYDRALYLKSPGLVTDVQALDRALATSSTKSAWAPLSASAGQDPEMMLYSRKKGLMMARGDTRRLTVAASVRQAGEGDAESATENAAYILFDDADLEQEFDGHNWYRDQKEEYQRQRKEVCQGKGILPGEEDKLDLKRKV